MDNHDNIHCFGANFQPISFTFEEYNVSPFLPEYIEQVNIPIFTDVTWLTLCSGRGGNNGFWERFMVWKQDRKNH